MSPVGKIHFMPNPYTPPVSDPSAQVPKKSSNKIPVLIVTAVMAVVDVITGTPQDMPGLLRMVIGWGIFAIVLLVINFASDAYRGHPGGDED